MVIRIYHVPNSSIIPVKTVNLRQMRRLIGSCSLHNKRQLPLLRYDYHDFHETANHPLDGTFRICDRKTTIKCCNVSQRFFSWYSKCNHHDRRRNTTTNNKMMSVVTNHERNNGTGFVQVGHCHNDESNRLLSSSLFSSSSSLSSIHTRATRMTITMTSSTGSTTSSTQQIRRMFHGSSGILSTTTKSNATTPSDPSMRSNPKLEGEQDDSSSGGKNHPPLVRMEKITTSNGGIIAHVILNRPHKHNALDMNMFIAIRQMILDIKHDRTIRVVILSGAGKSFCTGLDVASMFSPNLIKSNQNVQTLLQRPYQEENHHTTKTTTNLEKNDIDNNHNEINNEEVRKNMQISNLAQDVSYLWRILDVPVICAIHGMCYGGGYQIALGCDIRMACGTTSKFSIMESKWGLIPDMGISIAVRQLKISMDILKELTMTARIISAQQAHQYGFITHIVDAPISSSSTPSTASSEHVVKAAITLAEEMIERSPDAVALCKHLYQNTQQHQPNDLISEEYCLQLESEYQRKLLFSYNQIVTILRQKLGWKFLPYIYRKRT